MSEFNTGSPSIRQIQKFIKDNQEVELKLLTDDLLVGKITWQDETCLCLVDHYAKPTLVWRNAIAFMSPKS